MKLAHPDMHFVMDVDEDVFPVLVLERSDLYVRYIDQLDRQAEGEDGPFVLSENWEPMAVGKYVLVLTDLFHIDLNGRKQTAALYKQLNTLAVSERHHVETLALQSSIQRWIIGLENDLPYATIHNHEADMGAILKAAGIRFDDGDASIVEKLCTYIKICAAYLKTRLLVIAGLHDCLTPDDLRAVYQTALYEKLPLMSIERHAPDEAQPCENIYIIDRDLCEIYNDSDTDTL